MGKINEALRQLKQFLEQQYMPATRSTWGVAGWPDGKAVYEQCLKYHTSTDMTPQQVHDKGLSEVARIRSSMQSVSCLLYTSPSPRDSLRSRMPSSA